MIFFFMFLFLNVKFSFTAYLHFLLSMSLIDGLSKELYFLCLFAGGNWLIIASVLNLKDEVVL